MLKLLFGIYLMVTLVVSGGDCRLGATERGLRLQVLINLLIAMMSDTYQRIQAQSDKEWKYGRAKLISTVCKLCEQTDCKKLC